MPAKAEKKTATKKTTTKTAKVVEAKVAAENPEEKGAFSEGVSSVTSGITQMGSATKDAWNNLDNNEKAMVGVGGVGALGVAAVADEVLAPLGFLGQILLILGAIFGLAHLGSREEGEV